MFPSMVSLRCSDPSLVCLYHVGISQKIFNHYLGSVLALKTEGGRVMSSHILVRWSLASASIFRL
ncbi:hypothetical protein CY34DRAFT_814373 [Suillus luteus UH-Slu-Lm8-n1]|uniref:Uncharacterized protein n=1 Tax=Suillus luteus UH-Slu-Lm8-n1 TaxID=930992 RepID=A0A0D0A247_9AGAM|nr:hypothetical protein CY34DRAFT_814373 [Suillus luteus UH-Slu-Lm8-n1]